MEIGEEQWVKVKACVIWNDTKIDMRAGQHYTLEVVPENNRWVDGKSFLKYTSDANGRNPWQLLLGGFLKRHRAGKWFALTGAKGKESNQFFTIGKRLDLKVDSDYRLFCFANDWIKKYQNNSGEMDLKITRIR